MMRRNLVLIGAAVVAAGIGVYFTMSGGSEEESSAIAAPPPMISASLNELPNLSVTFGDQSSVVLRELTGNVILIFFNPDCDHCQHQAEQMEAEKGVFNGWQVYFIASVAASAAEEFGVKYRLTDPNFHFGSAGVSEVYGAVGALSEVPTIMIFKNRMFLEKYEGLTPVAQIKATLELP